MVGEKLECLSGFEPEYSRIVVSYISASRVTSLMTYRGKRDAPCLYDIFLHPIFSIELYLSHGILVSVHGYERHVRSSIPCQVDKLTNISASRVTSLMKHSLRSFFQLRNLCLSGIEPENSRMFDGRNVFKVPKTEDTFTATRACGGGAPEGAPPRSRELVVKEFEGICRVKHKGGVCKEGMTRERRKRGDGDERGEEGEGRKKEGEKVGGKDEGEGREAEEGEEEEGEYQSWEFNGPNVFKV
ncbi:hypothetical protein DAPPUDRAFT_120398 [Daphnia pulex]|uniref:Uncharacterized protein n=1 Tax=Daphnia pulex TaxID=6669 RepID=E9I191_DAPPU|nr:hypothetical protein DAPPUDRAFT_120398 [Daphnia pulex]|eukprot:EFX62239.1 hypothetical protein DAPPUDRAFT_120398 [Daphnia pulex]